MSEALKLQVNTGAVTVEVEDEKGRSVGTFESNPADSNILKRYGAVVDFFNGVEFAQGMSQDEELEAVNKLCDDIERQFDFLLGYPVSESLFKTCGPMSVMQDGAFYFEQVMEGLGGIIEKVTSQRLEKKMKKIDRAVQKAPKRLKE